MWSILENLLAAIMLSFLVLVSLFGIGLYLQLGLDITTRHGSIFYGPAVWLVWLFAPPIVVLITVGVFSE